MRQRANRGLGPQRLGRIRIKINGFQCGVRAALTPEALVLSAQPIDLPDLEIQDGLVPQQFLSIVSSAMLAIIHDLAAFCSANAPVLAQPCPAQQTILDGHSQFLMNSQE